MGYVPDLHKIWVGTSDQQLMALSNEFPGFYRYALIMEEASEAERNKASRPYDGMAGFSEEHKQRAAQLLVTAANLERGYQAFRGSGNLQVFQPQVNELGRLHRQWLLGPGFLGGTCSDPFVGTGRTQTGKAGGETIHRITFQSSS